MNDIEHIHGTLSFFLSFDRIISIFSGYTFKMPSLSKVKSSNAAISLAGKYAVVCGGTSGIGRGIALRLAQSRASVTIIGRNEEEGGRIVREMEAISNTRPVEQGEVAPPRYGFVRCDASLISNIKECSETLVQTHKQLDILVLSQGIASVDGYTPTSEGIERKLAVHYYGRIAFAKCLVPFMEATAGHPKILSVLSAGVHAPYAAYDTDPDLERNFSLKNAADAAGLYNDIGLDCLSKEHTRSTFIHSCPGLVTTNWGSEFPWYLRGPVRALQIFGRSAADCAEWHLFSLMNKAHQPGGFYLVDQNGDETRVTAMHDTARDTVWKHTEEVLAKFGVE